ncbi:DNA/RNA nuclease SfsA [Streptomyces sp. NPDC002623]
MTVHALQMRNKKICFAEPLAQATIVRRRNRFVIDVDVEGAEVACHCPTTGRIGNLVLDGLPCLLSSSTNAARKTPYTVEAVSVDAPQGRALTWIGINQTAANRYVEHALTGGLLSQIVTVHTIQREKFLGPSRLDFLVNDDTYVEVKTPLENLQVPLGSHVKTRPQPRSSRPTGWSDTSADSETACRSTSGRSCWSASSTTTPASRSSKAPGTAK